MISSPHKKDKKLNFEMAQVIINRVVDVLEDKKNVENIMKEFDKYSEGKMKRRKGIKSRIRIVS